jgi:glutamine synthetase
MPASLEAALEALAGDEAVRGWLKPLLYDAYVGVKRSELQAAESMDLNDLCRRYASIY